MSWITLILETLLIKTINIKSKSISISNQHQYQNHGSGHNTEPTLFFQRFFRLKTFYEI